jgi:hypothetical protein
MPVADFGHYLRARGDDLVLSFTNIRELAGPLGTGADFLQTRRHLRVLESLPHVYLKEVAIIGMELRSAVISFTGCADPPCTPFVPRWDYTLVLPPGERSATEDWVAVRLDELVYLISRSRRDIFAPPRRHLPRLRRQLEGDRDRLRRHEAPAREHFTSALKRHADSHRVLLPVGREDEFANWVYDDPSRCPGLRLHHETYRALMENYADLPEASDFSDLAHVYAIPYVDAGTLDRRMRHYCAIGARRMVQSGGAVDYGTRLFRDLNAVIIRQR